MRLRFCRDCGHVFNLAFNPELMEYSQAYENSLHFSPRFQSYAESQAAQLIERYDLRGKDIIEIGSGQGDFLRLLCELGENQGIGFDPSYVPEAHTGPASERITLIQDFYSERYADYAADFICCRHVLEHLQSPTDFLGTLRRSIGHQSDTIVFFEVPNVLFTLRELGIWDLIYEHPSYFSPGSLSQLFKSCRFDVYDLAETYEGQFLSIEAKPGQGKMQMARDPGDNLDEIKAYAEEFATKYWGKLKTWKRRLGRMIRAGRRPVIWGAGSKGVTFLNTFNTQALIKYAVDINPRKHDMYIAGTGQRIVPPGFLRDYQPEVVIVMNPIYESEIRQFTQRIGVTPEFICV